MVSKVSSFKTWKRNTFFNYSTIHDRLKVGKITNLRAPPRGGTKRRASPSLRGEADVGIQSQSETIYQKKKKKE